MKNSEQTSAFDKRKNIKDAKGRVFLGIDAGSTTAKSGPYR